VLNEYFERLVIYLQSTDVEKPLFSNTLGNSADKLRHPRFDAYSGELILLNKRQISGGGACLHCYHILCTEALQ